MALEGMHIGRYRLQRLIGSGGMGEVYLAEDTRIARKVAIKVMKSEADAQATHDATRLFEREMKAITTLDHPNILSLFDFGEKTIYKTTLTYMVMPFRTEGSLLDWLHQPGNANTLSPQQVIHIIQQAADALQHAHNRHLMHLDIKPSNFLLRHREDPSCPPDLLLADFGIAKFTTATATVSQSIRGTPAYMAPEQWAGTPSAATDQYALAIMAYQLLTGRLPFRGSMQQVLYQHLQEQPQAPSALNLRVPVTVDAVILRALAKKTEERFSSIQAFATAFEQAWKAALPPVQPELPQMQAETIAPPPSQASRSPELAFSSNLPAVPPESMVPPSPSQQQSFIAERSLDQLSSQPQSISRRVVVLGLVGLAVVGTVGGGLVWLTHPHSGFSDEFTSQLDPRWMWVDPGGDSTHSVTEQGFLRISLPSANRDLYPANNLNAPRLLQPITGDFTIETRIRFNPTFLYEGAGILAWENETSFLRLERAYADFSGFEFDQNVNGTYTRILSVLRSDHPGPSVTATLVDLRLQRTGNTFTASWRDPSSSQGWQTLGNTSIHFDSIKVGLILAAENLSGISQNAPISADYDYFRVS